MITSVDEVPTGIAKQELHQCDTCEDTYYSYEPKDEFSHQCPQCILRERKPVRKQFTYPNQ
jgi:7-cyano-7-deazaguanine synthase in queuosine biosynthesis